MYNNNIKCNESNGSKNKICSIALQTWIKYKNEKLFKFNKSVKNVLKIKKKEFEKII